MLRNIPPQSCLEKHILAFADTDGNISFKSIRDKLIELGDDEKHAYSSADNISFFAGLVVKYCPYRMFQAKEGVGVLNHARDTGIYNKDGSINEASWKELLTYAEMDKGENIITTKQLYNFLNVCRARDQRSDRFGLAEKASDGEWHDFFKLFSDYNKESANGEKEPCVTLKRLRLFYEDTPTLFAEIIKNKNMEEEVNLERKTLAM